MPNLMTSKLAGYSWFRGTTLALLLRRILLCIDFQVVGYHSCRIRKHALYIQVWYKNENNVTKRLIKHSFYLTVLEHPSLASNHLPYNVDTPFTSDVKLQRFKVHECLYIYIVTSTSIHIAHHTTLPRS